MCGHKGGGSPFSVSDELGTFFCHVCRESGDALRLVALIEDLDFAVAYERVATLADGSALSPRA